MITKNLHNQYVSYFKELAETHKEIGHMQKEKHFSRLDFEEYILGEVSLNFYPHLILESIEWNTKGQHADNLFLEAAGAIVVVDKYSSRNDDFADQQNTLNNCFNIVQDILAVMEDDMETLCHDLITYFDITSVDIQKLAAGTFDNATGYRCSFSFSKGSIPVEVDSSKWTNR